MRSFSFGVVASLALGLAGPALAQTTAPTGNQTGTAPGDVRQNGTPTTAPDQARTPADQTPRSRTATRRTPQTQALTGTRRSTADIGPSAIIADTRQPPQPGLLGDLFGLRPTLANQGIAFAASYASESAFNYTGGRKKLLTETGQLTVGALFDLDRLVGLKGGAIQGTITWRRGRDLDLDAGLDTLQQVQEVYGRGQTVRFTQLWYEQQIGPSVEIKVGRTNPGEDFAIFSCHFENLSFCGAQPGNLAGSYWQNWPISQWGGRIHVAVSRTFYVQTAAYEINPLNDRNNFFLGHFHGATGALIPVEVGHTVGGDTGLVGSYKVGGWYATGNADDVFLDRTFQPIVLTNLPALQRASRYGGYLNIQQQLTGAAKDGKSTTGLSVFLNVTQTDRTTSYTDNQVALGLFFKGLIPSVPGDVLGLGFARTHVNGRVARAERLDPTHPAVRYSEYAAELYYSIHPYDWLELRPNLQWIHHPGGVRQAADIGLLGLKGALTL